MPPLSRYLTVSLMLLHAATWTAHALGEDKVTGKQIYQKLCSSCHGAQGEGTEEHFPQPLTGKRNLDQLAGFISKSMPPDKPNACTPEEARLVAAYVFKEFYSPAARQRIRTPRKELSHLTVRQYQNAIADLIAEFGGVEQAVAQANANLLIANVPAADHVPEVFRRKRIDGVILKGALQGDLIGQTNRELLEIVRRLPTVWVMGRPRGGWGDAVQINDIVVGQLAATHLLSHGHRHLGFISPKPSHSTNLRRQASFMFYAQRAGAEVTVFAGEDHQWTFPSHAVDDVEMVQDLVDRALKSRKRPTAFFAPDDSIGAMTARALSARGLALGRDLSLISCNNEKPLLVGIYPQLTTLEVHSHEIGTRTVDQLAWRLAHPEAACVDIGVEPELVPGASVAQLNPPNGKASKSREKFAVADA